MTSRAQVSGIRDWLSGRSPAKDHDHRNDRHADDEGVHRLDSRCGRHAELPRGRNRGHADELLRVRVPGAQASNDRGSCRSLRERVPRYRHFAHDADDHDRDNQRGPYAERLYDHS
jgi:hypothetical protein